MAAVDRVRKVQVADVQIGQLRKSIGQDRLQSFFLAHHKKLCVIKGQMEQNVFLLRKTALHCQPVGNLCINCQDWPFQVAGNIPPSS